MRPRTRRPAGRTGSRLRHVVLPALAAVLGACAGPSPEAPQSRGATPPPIAVAGSWRPAGRAPSDYPVHGIDVSRWQGEIDWARVRASGTGFAFIKATEGADLLDPRFAANWEAAGRAGLPRGAYHFYYFCRPAIEQARWFIRHVPRERGALPPVLDMEWNHLSPSCRHRPPPGIVRAEMLVFLEALTRHYGRRPIIYVAPDFYRDNALARVTGYPFWLRSVAAHPETLYPGQPWVFWQYTGAGAAPGVAGRVDVNVFAGDAAGWRAWLAANAR